MYQYLQSLLEPAACKVRSKLNIINIYHLLLQKPTATNLKLYERGANLKVRRKIKFLRWIVNSNNDATYTAVTSRKAAIKTSAFTAVSVNKPQYVHYICLFVCRPFGKIKDFLLNTKCIAWNVTINLEIRQTCGKQTFNCCNIFNGPINVIVNNNKRRENAKK